MASQRRKLRRAWPAPGPGTPFVINLPSGGGKSGSSPYRFTVDSGNDRPVDTGNLTVTYVGSSGKMETHRARCLMEPSAVASLSGTPFEADDVAIYFDGKRFPGPARIPGGRHG